MAPDPNLIPGFTIENRVASGGVASVFRARREPDGLEVALKVMSLADMDPDFHPVERFKREAVLLERLNHPSLPRFFGFGVTEGGLGWIALELVKGQPLGAFKDRTVVDLLPIFIQTAEGLQAVAQEGIVHRDISPDNILVEERHGRAHARLIDFGIAKDLLAGDEGGGGLTQHGSFIGKLAYASPEQLVGLPKGETIDFRSDVYSLGMTMYELLTGRRAVKADGLSEVVDAHIKGNFPPLSITGEKGGPAPRLQALVTRMIARRRDDRPASWESVLAELWRCREDVAPLTETLARKRVALSSSDSHPAQEPAARTVTRRVPPPEEEDLPAFAQAALSREERIGRIVLVLGAISFVASLVYAVSYFRTPVVVLPEPTPTPVAVAEVPTATPVPPPPPTSTPAKKERATPAPVALRPTVAAPAEGTLEVSLLPAGELTALVDDRGRKVAVGKVLPVKIDLPPGRYTLTLTGRGVFDCSKTVTVTVNAGRTVVVKETCVVVK
ncbi:MAG: protein kinase [Acidobacteria bacterium]|nr:protein kinase [Acidobacteriota bacterium]